MRTIPGATTKGARSSVQAWWSWTLAVTFVVYLFSLQTGYAIVNPRVRGELGLSVGQIGTIAAVYMWAFAIFQLVGGALLDRVGARKVLPASIAIVTLGVFVFATARSYEVLLLSQLILALGSCSVFIGAGYVGCRWFGTAKFSVMFGLVQFAAALTTALTPNLMSTALRSVEWRTLFVWAGVFGVALACLVQSIKDPKPTAAETGDGAGRGLLVSVLRGIAGVAKVPHIWIASLQGAALFGTMLSVGVLFGPTLLSLRGVSGPTAALAASMLWVGLAIGSIVIVKWSDAIKSRRIPLLAATLLQLVAVLALVYVPGGAVLAMWLCFVIGFASAAHMLSFSTAADVVAPRRIGSSAAIVNGLMLVLGGIMIQRSAARVDAPGGMEPGTLELARSGAVPLVAALFVALGLALLMKDTYPRIAPSSRRHDARPRACRMRQTAYRMS
jgi:MFS family permease